MPKTSNVARPAARRAAADKANSPATCTCNTWPVVWRVVAPAVGSYGRDVVYSETENEAEAVAHYRALLKDRYAVRLERVQCGPLPVGAKSVLEELRIQSDQEPGSNLWPILGYWEARP